MSKVTEKSKMSGRHKNRPVGLTFKYFVSVLMCRHLYKVQVVVRWFDFKSFVFYQMKLVSKPLIVQLTDCQ